MPKVRRRSREALTLLTLAGLVGAGVGCKPKDGEVKEDSAGDSAKDSGDSATEPESEEQRAEAMVEELRLDERSFPLLIWSMHLVRNDYFDKDRFDPKGQLVAAMEFIGLRTPEFFGERVGEELVVTVRAAERRYPLGEVDDLGAAADLMEQILEFSAEVLGLEDEPLHELEYTAINGLLGPLDPHTILLTPEESADLGVKTRGRFGGIGAEIVAAERRILIVRVLPGSPAEAAGLRDMDVVLKIDGQSTVNLSSDDARNLLRGPVDTKVELQVRRGEELVPITITRGLISIPTINTAMLPDGIGYVQVTTFQEDTGEKLAAALESFKAQGPLAGLIVDLRGNSGGLLTQATAILDQVVEAGELVIVRSAHGREFQEAEATTLVDKATPIVALVDEQAASASEIVGGSLKHLDRGIILGRSSFGKGTVQELRNATPYGREVALKLTIAEYRVAGDRRIQSIGVIPDLRLLPVELSAYEGVARMYDLERFERQRERSRTAHLPSHKHDADISAELALAREVPLLRYFARGVPGSDGPEPTPTLTDETPRELRDPEIRLAREVALGLEGVVGRRAQLEALPGIVAKLAEQEDQQIREAVTPWKIDWSPVDDPADRETKLELGLAILGEGPYPVGQPFTVHVEVHNPSERELERVHLITDCDRDDLDGIELLIGKLGPGQTETRDIDLQIGAWHRSFVDVLRVDAHIGEPGAQPDGSTELRFATTHATPPRFSYDYWLIDDPRLVAKGPKRPPVELLPGDEPFTVQGNGDGLLQPGERVMLAYRARNAGGFSPDARVLLRNLSGRQGLLEEGSYLHGELDAGAEFMGAFGITMSPQADPALPLELELIVGDGVLRESVDDKLRFRIVPGRDGAVEVEGPSKRTVEGEEALRLYNGADASSAVVSELPAGAVLEVSVVAGEWLAIAGDRGEGRRLWLPADRVREGGQGPLTAVTREHLMIDPPIIELNEVPSVVQDGAVELSGTALHHRRVRDVVVTVRAPGPSQPERKVFYLANREEEGEEAKRLEFRTPVELSPGSNRITLLVRDHDKVERVEEVWVYRE